MKSVVTGAALAVAGVVAAQTATAQAQDNFRNNSTGVGIVSGLESFDYDFATTLIYANQLGGGPIGFETHLVVASAEVDGLTANLTGLGLYLSARYTVQNFHLIGLAGTKRWNLSVTDGFETLEGADTYLSLGAAAEYDFGFGGAVRLQYLGYDTEPGIDLDNAQLLYLFKF